MVEPLPSTCEALGLILSNVTMEAPCRERPAPTVVKSLLSHYYIVMASFTAT